ncbi:MAG: DUF1566 domain-containing protein [Rikenellaceae bacterium]
MKKLTLILSLTLLSVSAQAKEVSYKINATGQTKFYDLTGKSTSAPKPGDALYGQDANYKKGSAMSFKDNGNGTVTDTNTQLMWQQTPPSEGMTWSQAKEYCEKLELGGYSDWRMPTLKELFSISNFEQGWPYIDSKYFNLSSKDQVGKDEQYWADNKYVGETAQGRDDAAFGVNHATGHIKAYPAGSKMGNRGPGQGQGQGQQARGGQRPPQADSLAQKTDSLTNRPPQGPPPGGQQQGQRGQQARQGGQNRGGGQAQRPPQGGQGGRPMGNPMAKQIRAVRGNIYGINKFKDNKNGTISDSATGLMWSKDDNGKGVEWAQALSYAESSTLAGYSDWRLPNVKELQSIVDYTRAPSKTKTEAAIDPIFNCTGTINEAKDPDFGYYWSSTSACFRKGKPFYFAWYVAFGKAVNNKGVDFHGAGAVRFDSKSNNGMAVEGGEERYFNFVRLVRDIK